MEKRKGFGVVSIIFSVLIATSLTSLILPAFQKLNDQTKKLCVQYDRKQIAVSLENYYRDHHHYPYGQNSDLVTHLQKGNYFDFDGDFLKKNQNGFFEFLDPWGSPYVYQCDQKKGVHAEYLFYSKEYLLRFGHEENLLPHETKEKKLDQQDDNKKEKKKDQTSHGGLLVFNQPKNSEDSISDSNDSDDTDSSDSSNSDDTDSSDSSDSDDTDSSDSSDSDDTDSSDSSDSDDTDSSDSSDSDDTDSSDSSDSDDTDSSDGGKSIKNPEVHIIANDRKILLNVSKIPDHYSSFSLIRSKDSEEFQTIDLSFFRDGGQVLWQSGEDFFIFFDFNLENNSTYRYKFTFYLDDEMKTNKFFQNLSTSRTSTADRLKKSKKLVYPQSLTTTEISATPIASATDRLQESKKILEDPKMADVQGQYSYQFSDVTTQFNNDNIPLLWGYDEADDEENTTLAYIISRKNAQSDQLENYIVCNQSLRNASKQKIATVLSHELIHYYWNEFPPPLPAGIQPSASSDELTKRGEENRSFNSVDEEFECFLFSILFWEKLKTSSISDSSFDTLLNLLKGADGMKELRDHVRVLYRELPEY